MVTKKEASSNTKKNITKNVPKKKNEATKVDVKKVKINKKNYGVASVILGVIGLFFFPVIFGTAGLIVGIFGLKNKEEKKMSLIGIVISSISILSWLIFLIINFL